MISRTQLARHALGLPNERNRSYRNRYYVSPGNPAYAEWMAMCANGDAEHSEARKSTGMRLFQLTRVGADKVLMPGESLDPEDFPV